MSCFGIKSTLLPEPIRWVVDFDDYDEDKNGDFNDWMMEQAEEIKNLVASNPQGAFVVDYDQVENDFDRDFYRQYLGDTKVGDYKFTQAFYVFGELAYQHETGVEEALAAIYYANVHDWDSEEVMRFVNNTCNTSFTMHYSTSEHTAAEAHLKESTSWSLASLLIGKGIVVEAADAHNHGKYTIGEYTGYAWWVNSDEDY